MNAQAVTLHLPAELYDRFERRARETHRSVETEILEVVATAAPKSGELPAEIAQALEDLRKLDDEALWRAAQERFSEDAAARLEELNLKQQREGLRPEEKQTLAQLLDGCDRVMAMRSEAAWLLKQRGHDVSGLIGRE